MTVLEREVLYRGRRILVARVGDGTGEMQLRFVNFYPSMLNLLTPGTRLRAFGEARAALLGVEMVHPKLSRAQEGAALPQTLTPVYPSTAGLSQQILRRLIEQALAHEDLDDTVSAAMCARLNLPSFAATVAALHRPAPTDTEAVREPFWQRVRFDELLAQQASLQRAYLLRRNRRAPPIRGGGALAERLLAGLPFRLTAAQQRVWGELRADLSGEQPMQRLLQGDVGSGKTVLAALCAAQVIEAGFQSALLAPTEILAEQHFVKLRRWLEPHGVPVVWLSGKQRAKAKRAALGQLAGGGAGLVIGTHALIQDAVDFQRLGLAIVDEQHRFGVRQRLALRAKGTQPHQLAMSATPIPRTLAMSYYADLDVSTLDELPPGRTPVLTRLVQSGRRDEVISRVRRACAAGAQAYWVCPLIEESEALQLQTAQQTHERLREQLPEISIGLVHGRLALEEKSRVMADFQSGALQLLVATTVIEVGVDVPNASLMVIENAERFGLAQLHQLRGRVGRGSAGSTCILVYQTPLSANARERLRIVYQHQDGFEIARLDLELRGPGEFIGARQSGVPLLRFADLKRDEELLREAREVASRLLRDDPPAVERHLARWLPLAGEFLSA